MYFFENRKSKTSLKLEQFINFSVVSIWPTVIPSKLLLNFAERIYIFHFALLSEIVGTHVFQFCMFIIPETLPRT